MELCIMPQSNLYATERFPNLHRHEIFFGSNRKKSIKGNASKALQYGITHAESKGKLRKYMDSLYFYNKKATNTRIYNHYVYIFCGETLITIFDLPKNLRHIADDIQRKKKASERNDGR